MEFVTDYCSLIRIPEVYMRNVLKILNIMVVILFLLARFRPTGEYSGFLLDYSQLETRS